MSPDGHVVVAVDLQTCWIESLACPLVEIRQGDFEPWTRRPPEPSREDADIAAEITAITIDRLRARTSTPPAHVEKALAALSDPSRSLARPTRWIVRARVGEQDGPVGGPT